MAALIKPVMNFAGDDRKAARYIDANDKGRRRLAVNVSRRFLKAIASPFCRYSPSCAGCFAAEQFIATVQDDAPALRFVCSNDVARLAELGTSCPDHFLRTKIKPLYVDWNPQIEDTGALLAKLTVGLEAYRADYAAYYDANRLPDSPAIRDPNPTVILIPCRRLLCRIRASRA